MNKFTIVCDSACDLSPEMLRQRGVEVVPLSFHFDGERKEYTSLNTKDFYSKMRSGRTAKTAGVNIFSFKSTFEPILKSGKDILYLGFSSALSITFNSAKTAADELSTVYPNRKIITIDTLCASAGIALLLDMILAKDADVEDVKAFVEAFKLKVCHWFTVDNLEYLKRGGRIGADSAIVGNMLGIKPILHVDKYGRLVPVAKVRGRRSAINTLTQKYGEMHEGDCDVYISHADCPDDAELLANTLKNKYNANVRLITSVGPVIGAHSGPGTLALFFIGKERHPPTKQEINNVQSH